MLVLSEQGFRAQDRYSRRCGGNKDAWDNRGAAHTKFNGVGGLQRPNHGSLLPPGTDKLAISTAPEQELHPPELAVSATGCGDRMPLHVFIGIAAFFLTNCNVLALVCTCWKMRHWMRHN